jgi:hypothetical protein
MVRVDSCLFVVSCDLIYKLLDFCAKSGTSEYLHPAPSLCLSFSAVERLLLFQAEESDRAVKARKNLQVYFAEINARGGFNDLV